MKLTIYKKDGSKSLEKEFTDIPTFEEKKGLQALKDVIVAYQANARQGNASTKTRAQVSGSGKKPWRQKGLGSSRHGSRRSPIWVGGGVAFGPQPRDFSKKITRKVKSLAFRRALFNCARNGDFSLIEAFELNEPKTKLFNDVLQNTELKGSVLLVDDSFEANVALAARNMERVFVTDAQSLNAWDLMRFDNVLASEKAFQTVLNRSNSEKAN